MLTENEQILYWSEMLDEAFPEESLLSEGDHWPEDFVRRAVNRIKKSAIGKTDWFDEEKIRKDVERMARWYETAEMTHNSKEANLFKTVVKWMIEYTGSSRDRYVVFVRDRLRPVLDDLRFFTENRAVFEEYYEKLRNEMSFKEFRAECEKIENDKEALDRLRMKNFTPSEKGYELLKIDSYEQFNDIFGGGQTGGRKEGKGWCHANDKNVYDSWIQKGRNVFFVLFKWNWYTTEPSFESLDDEYGRSAIALRVSKITGKLLNATFRYNHVVEPERKPTDNVVSMYSQLSEIAGFDVEKRVKEAIGWDEEKVKNRNEFELKWGDGDGNINCSHSNLKSLEGSPGKVEGNFDCSGNWLSDLQGAPKEVEWSFNCAGCGLKSLVGSPEMVGSDFYCHNNKLESLEGGPLSVGGSYYCGGNLLKSLAGCPEKIGGSFVCNLTYIESLEGGPGNVEGNFDCGSNALKNLIGAPSSVGGTFDCNNNRLTSLEGAPEKALDCFFCNNKLRNLACAPLEVVGWFDCSRNRLTSLEGGPEKVGRVFECSKNRLINLVGAPSAVEWFDCSHNELTSLRGAPSRNSDFICDGNPGLPKEKIAAYHEYLKNPDPELTDETGHYAPKED